MRQRQQPSEAWTGPSSTSKHYEITKSLTGLSVRRQADVSAETYAVYVEDLLRFQIDDIDAACKAIGSEPRKSGEKAFPEIGVILEEVIRQEKRRRGDQSAVSSCEDPECMYGMVRTFDKAGWPTGVIPCKTCGGPTWYDDALEHNAKLPKRR